MIYVTVLRQQVPQDDRDSNPSDDGKRPRYSRKAGQAMYVLLPFILALRITLLFAITLFLTVMLMRNAISGLLISGFIAVSQHHQFITSLAALREEGSVSAVLMALKQFTVG